MFSKEAIMFGILVGSCVASYRAGVNSERTDWQAEKIKIEQQNQENLNLALKRQLDLTQQIESTKKVTQDEIHQHNVRINDLTRRLRERPSRQDRAVPNPSCPDGTQSGATGSQLYQEDGEFLARESSRAAEALSLLKGCRESYTTLFNRLTQHNKER